MGAMYNNITSHSIIQEPTMMPTLMNQKIRFPDSYIPQGLISTMSLDDIINKTKEMYIIYNFYSYYVY